MTTLMLIDEKGRLVIPSAAAIQIWGYRDGSTCANVPTGTLVRHNDIVWRVCAIGPKGVYARRVG